MTTEERRAVRTVIEGRGFHRVGHTQMDSDQEIYDEFWLHSDGTRITITWDHKTACFDGFTDITSRESRH